MRKKLVKSAWLQGDTVLQSQTSLSPGVKGVGDQYLGWRWGRRNQYEEPQLENKLFVVVSLDINLDIRSETDDYYY